MLFSQCTHNYKVISETSTRGNMPEYKELFFGTKFVHDVIFFCLINISGTSGYVCKCILVASLVTFGVLINLTDQSNVKLMYTNV